jgi:hypothetical protein
MLTTHALICAPSDSARVGSAFADGVSERRSTNGYVYCLPKVRPDTRRHRRGPARGPRLCSLRALLQRVQRLGATLRGPGRRRGRLSKRAGVHRGASRAPARCGALGTTTAVRAGPATASYRGICLREAAGRSRVRDKRRWTRWHRLRSKRPPVVQRPWIGGEHACTKQSSGDAQNPGFTRHPRVDRRLGIGQCTECSRISKRVRTGRGALRTGEPARGHPRPRWSPAIARPHRCRCRLGNQRNIAAPWTALCTAPTTEHRANGCRTFRHDSRLPSSAIAWRTTPSTTAERAALVGRRRHSGGRARIQS